MNLDRALIAPLALIGAVVLFWAGTYFGLLPDPNILLDDISMFLVERGVFWITLVALLENVVGLNTYFPGSIVILGVMASTAGDVASGLKIYSAIVMGQLAGLTLSHLIGRTFGTGKMPVQPRRFRSVALVLLFWHPHGSAATSFMLGANRVANSPLIILVGCVSWSTFWALIMYYGAGFVIRQIGWDYVTITFAILWFIFEIYRRRASTDENM